MKRTLLAILLLAAPAVVAADAAQGENAFRVACSNCHSAIQYRQGQPRPHRRADKALKHMGPDLGVVLRSSGMVAFKKWVKDPWAVQSGTACDPRLLRTSQIDDLIAFLAAKSRQEPARERKTPSYRRQR